MRVSAACKVRGAALPKRSFSAESALPFDVRKGSAFPDGLSQILLAARLSLAADNSSGRGRKAEGFPHIRRQSRTQSASFRQRLLM
jgi:hypothetical protein